MEKEKMKQIILIVTAFIFIGIGWINFLNQSKKSLEVAAKDVRNELNLGDVQLVNSEISTETPKEYLVGVVPNDEIQNNIKTEIINNQTNINQEVEDYENNIQKLTENEIQEIETSNINNEENSKDEYFIETKLQRDSMYSETLEIYQKMLENPEVGESQKAIAAQEISNINNTKNAIMIAENLIQNKGFEDVVILVNNGVVSVVIKSSLLNQEQIAKIQNIVSRELNVELKNINISKK